MAKLLRDEVMDIAGRRPNGYVAVLYPHLSCAPQVGFPAPNLAVLNQADSTGSQKRHLTGLWSGGKVKKWKKSREE